MKKIDLPRAVFLAALLGLLTTVPAWNLIRETNAMNVDQRLVDETDKAGIDGGTTQATKASKLTSTDTTAYTQTKTVK